MKKILISLFLILTIIFFIIPRNSFAATSTTDIIAQGDAFIREGEKQYSVNNDDLADIVIPIARILVAVGLVVVVVATAIMGIKYMTASPENRGKLKTQFVGLVIATIVIFGAQFIWRTLYEFFSNF